MNNARRITAALLILCVASLAFAPMANAKLKETGCPKLSRKCDNAGLSNANRKFVYRRLERANVEDRLLDSIVVTEQRSLLRRRDEDLANASGRRPRISRANEGGSTADVRR